MPIKGLTDRGAALPRIGIIRKGGPKTGNRPGPDLTHFRFVSEFPEAAAQFEQQYGKEPKEINVFLLFDEVADNFGAWQEEWIAGGLKHRCDGETCVLWLDPKTNKYRTDAKPCPGGCKPVGRLSVLVPELGHIATIMVLTTSKHDIVSIQQALEAAKWTHRNGLFPEGRLAGIPFVLVRREREISTPTQDNKRARRKKSLLWIEPAHHYAVAALKAMDSTPLLLPPGQTNGESEEDEEAFVDQITGEIVGPHEEPADNPPKPANAQQSNPTSPTSVTIPEKFTSGADFMEWTTKTLGIKPSEVLKELNVKSLMEVADLQEAAENLKAIRTGPEFGV